MKQFEIPGFVIIHDIQYYDECSLTVDLEYAQYALVCSSIWVATISF